MQLDRKNNNFMFFNFISEWISPIATDETSARCKYCKFCVLKAHKKSLLQHAKSEKHLKSVALNKSAKTCQKLPAIYKIAFSEKTKIAELKLAAFIAEHSAIQTVDHLTNILPQLDTSSDTMSSFKLHRTKCTMLIKNVLGPAMLSKLLEDIGNFPFFIIVDESTDHSTQKVV